MHPVTVRAESLGYAETREVWSRGEAAPGAGHHKPRIAEWEAPGVHLTQQEHRARAQGSCTMLWPHGPTVSVTGFVFLCFRAGALSLRPSDLSQGQRACAWEHRPFCALYWV